MVNLLRRLVPVSYTHLDVYKRQPLSELRVGLKCGGSDGFSGITANPLLGMFSDFLIAQGRPFMLRPLQLPVWN